MTSSMSLCIGGGGGSGQMASRLLTGGREGGQTDFKHEGHFDWY